MYAIEFETQIKNGTVQIPENFKELYAHKKAKVILMIDDIQADTKSENDWISTQTNNPIHIDSSVDFLSREQANER